MLQRIFANVSAWNVEHVLKIGGGYMYNNALKHFCKCYILHVTSALVSMLISRNSYKVTTQRQKIATDERKV